MNYRSQWAAPGLNRGAPERSGQHRASTGSSRAEWVAPGLSDLKKLPENILEKIPKKISEDMPKIFHKKCQNIS